MKQIILTFLIFGGFVLMSGQVVNGQALELVRQYFECRNLTMYFNGHVYVRNTSIPNNFLDDAFYQQAGLGQLNITKSYTDTDNCNTRFCNCVNWGFIDSNITYYNGYYSYIPNNKYSIFFRNSSNYPGVKAILSAFNTENNVWDLKTLAELNQTSSYSWYYRWPYPTIIKFLLLAEFTQQKQYTYNNWQLQRFCYNFNELSV